MFERINPRDISLALQNPELIAACDKFSEEYMGAEVKIYKSNTTAEDISELADDLREDLEDRTFHCGLTYSTSQRPPLNGVYQVGRAIKFKKKLLRKPKIIPFLEVCLTEERFKKRDMPNEYEGFIIRYSYMPASFERIKYK